MCPVQNDTYVSGLSEDSGIRICDMRTGERRPEDCGVIQMCGEIFQPPAIPIDTWCPPAIWLSIPTFQAMSHSGWFSVRKYATQLARITLSSVPSS
jgi:hypothetical protein